MEVYVTLAARQHIKKLSRANQKRIIDKIEFYVSQPDPIQFAEPLTGSNEYRFRVGDYRIRFEVLNDIVWVISVKRRDEACR